MGEIHKYYTNILRYTVSTKITKVSYHMNDINWNWRANWKVVVEFHIEKVEIKNSIPGSVI